MKGVGDSQPVNPTQADNNQGADNATGCFGRFKVSAPKSIRNIFSAVRSEKKEKGIVPREIRQHASATQQSTITSERNGSSEKAGDFEDALKKAATDPNARQCFARIEECLNKIQKLKMTMQHYRRHGNNHMVKGVDLKLAKANYDKAVTAFNKATANLGLRIDSYELETAFANQNSPELNKTYEQYKQMKDVLIAPES